VQGADHQTEYVMVHIRDLREENRRAEAELDRQLECVRTAIELVRDGKVPPEPGPTLRRPVLETVAALKRHALELQERADVMAGQVETMRGRMSREGGLKKTVHGRMEQIQGEVTGLSERLVELTKAADNAALRVSQVAGRGRMVTAEYDEARRRALELARDVKQCQTIVGNCLRSLEQTEEIAGRVRSNERMIRALMSKSAVLNANNSILGSKRELTPTDVVTITENITQLMNQFERSYRVIETSVDEVDRGLAQLGVKLREGLKSCEKLTADDHGVSRTIVESGKLVEASADETRSFVREVEALKAASLSVREQIRALETKSQALCQIGQASVALQGQLELGFEGMFSAVAPARGPGGAKLGGSA
jgi:chromosome segregation ATPase